MPEVCWILRGHGDLMAIHTEAHDGYGVLSLDRIDKANAYDRAHLDALEAGFIALSAEAHVVVIRALGGGAFCGGADLDEMREATPDDARQLRSQAVFTTIARSPAITIAAVDGPAIGGGCELALACDIRLVGPGARFGLPETSLGIIPAAGGCTRLQRLLGASVAKQLILGGRTLDAERAVQLGLAMALHEDPTQAAFALATELAQRSPEAMRMAKEIIDRRDESASLEAERLAQAELYALRRN
jgi:enoyl-CoA hydratase/carnithine racemase